jgi:hypothetical protein
MYIQFKDNIPVTFLQISIIEKNGIKLYKCRDGQHRRSAIKMLQNNSMVDSTIKNKFKCIVYKNDTSDGIKKKFININKSVPVPSVIIERLENEIKGETSMNKYEKIYKADQIGETIKKYMSETFKEYIRPSDSPQSPYFNKDKLFSIIVNYITENNLYNMNPKDLFDKILVLNHNMGLKYNGMKLSMQMKGRLIRINNYKTKCYLFLEYSDFTNLLE